MSVGVECLCGLLDVTFLRLHGVLFTAVSVTEEHLTSVTSGENCQSEYNVLRPHTALLNKFLFQLPQLHVTSRFRGSL
jgi:hypothetical protein